MKNTEEKKVDTKKKSTTGSKKGNQSKGKSTNKKSTTTKNGSTKTTKKTITSTLKKETVKEPVKKVEVKEEKVVEEKVTETKKTVTKKIKTGDILLVVGLAVVVLLGCFVLKGEKQKPNYELPLTLSGEAGMHELSYAGYQEKIDNNESFVVVIERATCSHCVSYMPVAEEFAKENNVPMYYVDTDTFSEEDWASFESSNSFFKKNSGQWGTPTTIVLAGSEAVDYIEGETTADNLKELYDKYFEMNN